jgi:hypothetical protein
MLEHGALLQGQQTGIGVTGGRNAQGAIFIR